MLDLEAGEKIIYGSKSFKARDFHMFAIGVSNKDTLSGTCSTYAMPLDGSWIVTSFA